MENLPRLQVVEGDITVQRVESSLSSAVPYGLRNIAFPAIGTGIYGFPLDCATRIAIATIRSFVRAHSTPLEEVRFVCFGSDTLQVYEAALTAQI